MSVKCDFNIHDSSIAYKAGVDILVEIGKEEKKPKKIKDEQVNWVSYKTISENELINLRENIIQMQDIPNTENLNDVVDSLTSCLYNSAQTCSTKLTRPESDTNKSTPTLSYTNIMEEADFAFRMYCGVNIFQEDWDYASKEAVKSMGYETYKKEVEKWRKIQSCEDSKELWKGINWNSKETTMPDKEGPTVDELAEQFKLKGSGEFEDLSNINVEYKYVPELDKDISMEEIQKAANNLKEGQNTCDGWYPR